MYRMTDFGVRQVFPFYFAFNDRCQPTMAVYMMKVEDLCLLLEHIFDQLQCAGQKPSGSLGFAAASSRESHCQKLISE